MPQTLRVARLHAQQATVTLVASHGSSEADIEIIEAALVAGFTEGTVFSLTYHVPVDSALDLFMRLQVLYPTAALRVELIYP